MAQLILDEFMTLDGVVQAPGGSDEDPTGGFEHGGWHMRYMDDLGGGWVLEYLRRASGFVLGRRTYEIFASYWPNAPEEVQEFARPMNSKPKYVASTTLTEPLSWQNSRLLGRDVLSAVRALKQQGDGELHVIGSIHLAQTLLAHDLVDALRITIDPVVVGGGKRLFRDDGRLRSFRLVSSQVTSTGVILATYATPGARLADFVAPGVQQF